LAALPIVVGWEIDEAARMGRHLPAGAGRRALRNEQVALVDLAAVDEHPVVGLDRELVALGQRGAAHVLVTEYDAVTAGVTLQVDGGDGQLGAGEGQRTGRAIIRDLADRRGRGHNGKDRVAAVPERVRRVANADNVIRPGSDQGPILKLADGAPLPASRRERHVALDGPDLAAGAAQDDVHLRAAGVLAAPDDAVSGIQGPLFAAVGRNNRYALGRERQRRQQKRGHYHDLLPHVLFSLEVRSQNI
jgi:hypothetical protein